MTDINWHPPQGWPDKPALLKAIVAYIREHTSIANALLPTLEKMNVDDLALIAMCFGYQPSAQYVARRRQQFDWEDERVVAQKAQWDKEHEKRQAQRVAASLTAQSILAMSDDEIRLMANLTLGGEEAVEEQVAKVRGMIARLSNLLPPDA